MQRLKLNESVMLRLRVSERDVHYAGGLVNGAWVAHDEAAYGMLRPGLAADLVVLDGDPFEASEAIRDIPVVMTISRGDVTYCTDDLR